MGPGHQHACVAALERHLGVLDLNDVPDETTDGDDLVSGLELRQKVAMPLLLLPLRHDEEEVEDRHDGDQLYHETR